MPTEHPGLARLRAMHEAASPPPWRPDENDYRRLIATDEPDGWNPTVVACRGESGEENTTIILTLRNAVTALIGFIELVSADIGEVRVNDGEVDGQPMDWCDECASWIQRKGHAEGCTRAVLDALLSVLAGEGE